MEDTYPYSLIVELEENSFPKLKYKLVKYFQSRKSSGGDCEVDYEEGSATAVVRFRREEDKQNVLAKEVHQIGLDCGVLNALVRSPPHEPGAQKMPSGALNKKSAAETKGRQDETEDEELNSTSVVLENIPARLSEEFVEMMVESIINSALEPSSTSQKFTLEFIPDLSSAVVTFQTVKEAIDFMEQCPQNKNFTCRGMSVQRLEATKQVVVEDFQSCSEDLLLLYLERAGGDVENVLRNEVDQSAIITFKDHKAAQKIMKKKHKIKQEEIRVYPFYKSLGRALYGKDRLPPRLPDAISEPIDRTIWKYLLANQPAAETVHRHLAKHFCCVNFILSTALLSPMPSLLQQKDAKAIIKTWTDTVKAAFAQALSQFKFLNLHPESEVWEEYELKIKEILWNENMVTVSDKVNGVLSVVGFVADVNRLEPALEKATNEIVKRLQRTKSTLTIVIQVSPSIFHILCQNGLQDMLLSVYPELKMSFTKGSSDLMLTGLYGEITSAIQVILDKMSALKRQTLESDKFLLELLKGDDKEELTNTLLRSNGINAAFDIGAHKVQLVAVSHNDLKNAEDHLRRLLISQHLDVEDKNVLKKPEWKDLVQKLQNTKTKSSRRIQIHTTDQQVVVSGHKDDIVQVSSELNEFLRQNAHVEETVFVKPSIKVEYVKKRENFLLDKVVMSHRAETICLSGSRGDVAKCKTLVENLVSSVIVEHLIVTKPGVKILFRDQEAMYLSSLYIQTGCVVQLDETSAAPVDVVHRQISKLVDQPQTTNAVEIVVSKTDLCSYTVNAVISPTNSNLKQNEGLSGALLKAAGPQLQSECDKIIAINGQLKPGDCVITDAMGSLRCKKVIFAVGPQFESTQFVLSQSLLKKVVKGSLELAGEHGCQSVALPAISRSQGFNLQLCADTIIKAVKEHCEGNSENTLKAIHFVDNNFNVVQAFEKAVKQEYGGDGSRLFLSPKVIKCSPVTPTGSDPNRLGHVQTKEGLDILLMKGNIENSMTAVVVNAVTEDLVLTNGAISNAIFRMAGPKLQQVINAKKALGNIGDIIVTEGCDLKSEYVFHTVPPMWDNGQRTAKKTLSNIFKDCLCKAEDTGLSSMSFPAIGTGNLGFPKDIAASLMLGEISSFSSKNPPKHLKKVVIVLYPGDTQTIQVFTREFNKFGNVSVVPGPASSGHFSKVVSNSGMHETKLGSVTIQVVSGSITKETSEVIVNSSNASFSLKSGVSKAILDAAGQTIENQCRHLGSKPNTGIILTEPGNLKCKKILHIVGPSDSGRIRKVMKEALQMCVTNSFTSVSFPAIGTGQGNIKPKQVADAMLDTLVDVLSHNTSSALKMVRIVIFQLPMLQDFCDSMKEREAPQPIERVEHISGNLSSKINKYSTGSSKKLQKAKSFVVESVTVDPACFYICGESQAQIDSAKKMINEMISREQDRYSISDNAIRSFSDADRQHIVTMQKTMNVSVRTETKKAQTVITIEGLRKDVFKATNEIHEMVRKAKEKEKVKKKVELTSMLVDWQYNHQGLQFQSFDSVSNYHLEQGLKTGRPTVEVAIQGRNYTIHMPSGPAVDDKGCRVEIKRIAKNKDEETPGNWDAMPANTPCKVKTIQAGTAEHTEVQNLFHTSCRQTITKIERIQNPALWKSLEIKKQDMEQRNGHQNNERRLFHGTCHETVAYINQHGFNRSYAGKNAAMFGNGTYFAVQASYSAQDTYSRPNKHGEKCMYLCRVLTGDYTLGHQNMIAPPSKNSVSIQKYDSVVDNEAHPNMFIIFHDSQAYPEYLITFKR
ncbi:poly(ADP-ribose) polymerase family member 14-related sequence 1 isoform X2 [Antennarius striatus]|uniref:poly(ADP-ribose) polymerase family member 14-related sequence 1 isoform X2 n=1 Tax=Antennarius striatus TaxID=241820 RepID=UPI0035B03578